MDPLCFYEPRDFAWTRAFIDAHAELRREVEAQQSTMTPVYPKYTEAVSGDQLKRRAWFTRTLVFFTIKNTAALAEMPVTSRLLAEIPDLVTAMFARMEGGTHLKAHCGYSPDTIRCHFGVVVPEPDAAILRVENERRTWAEGDWLIFDDYLEHEVWHHGKESRTVLLIDVVRPKVEAAPKKIAHDFFSRAPGTRFDEELAGVAPPEKWLEWLEAGQFTMAERAASPVVRARRGGR